jgi:hypothetical protein
LAADKPTLLLFWGTIGKTFLSWIMRIHENYPKMAELLRLVSYYNLPRYLAWISIAKYLGIFVLQESIDWFSKENLSRKQCFLPPLCGF